MNTGVRLALSCWFLPKLTRAAGGNWGRGPSMMMGGGTGETGKCTLCPAMAPPGAAAGLPIGYQSLTLPRTDPR